MFVAFILELTTSESAELVARAATTGSGDHARLAVAGGPVAAILISRAVAVDTAGLETDESLHRFSGAFAAALP